MVDDQSQTTDHFSGFSRQELWRRAEAFRSMSREAAAIPERNRLEALAREHDAACDRAWRGATNV
jgi:hypothetical protein